MSRSLGLARFDLLRPLDMLSSLWSSAAALPPVSAGAAVAYRSLFMTIRRLVVGRTLTVAMKSGDITLTVTEIESTLDVGRLAVGQLNDIELKATNIAWADQVFDNASLVLRNVHLRPGVPPVLVAAPVDVTLEVPTSALSDLIGSALPNVSGHVDDDGVARLRYTRWPRLASIEVETTLDGSTLWLAPRVLTVGGRRWQLPNQIPPYPVQLPDLAGGLTLTNLELSPNAVQLTGRLPQWRVEVPRARIEDLLNQLSAVGKPLILTPLGLA